MSTGRVTGPRTASSWTDRLIILRRHYVAIAPKHIRDGGGEWRKRTNARVQNRRTTINNEACRRRATAH